MREAIHKLLDLQPSFLPFRGQFLCPRIGLFQILFAHAISVSPGCRQLVINGSFF
jgi:hypothetical protein